MGMAQLGPILRDLERQRTWCDLDGPLGETLADEAADVFLEEMDAQVDPDGAAWAELSEAYAEYKQTVAPGAPISVLFGHMKTLDQLRGQRWFSADEARMVYGVDEEAKQLASWFIEGNENQPARRFYEFSEACEARMDQVIRRHIEGLF